MTRICADIVDRLYLMAETGTWDREALAMARIAIQDMDEAIAALVEAIAMLRAELDARDTALAEAMDQARRLEDRLRLARDAYHRITDVWT